ncbi:ubiquitin elongating factor core-domain-containing protein [Obelidium mucronatum]|nr:ubiquitin elongating factor core-domain-containing protein [Obelidium mucronatum]
MNPQDNTPQSDDYDTIRAKRLAKMMGSGSSGAVGSPGAAAASASASASASAASLAPAGAHNTTQKPKPPPAAAAAGPQSPVGTPSAQNKALLLFANATPAAWTHQTLAFVFHVELNEAAAAQKGAVFLAALAQELTQEGLGTTLLAADMTDRIIHARLSRPENALSVSHASNPPLFDYLVGAWKRCREAHRRILSLAEKASSASGIDAAQFKTLVETRVNFLLSTKELIVSYSGLVVNPDVMDMFPQSDEITKQGAGYIASKLLLDGFAAEEQLPLEFLNEFTARFENDGLAEIMGPVINSVTASMRFQDITTDYMTPIRAFGTLVSNKAIASVLISMPNYLPPNTAARTFELLTILGPYFAKPCVFNDEQGKVGQTYFASGNAFAETSNHDREGQDIGSRNFGDVESAMTNLRGTISAVQTSLHGLAMSLIKSGPTFREAVLKFFAEAITVNHARGRMQVDPKTVGTDGFLFNIGKVCLQLADPIMDPNFSKIHLIEPFHFLRASPRLPQPPSTTMMNADDEFLASQRQIWAAQNANVAPANFVTDVFVLTLGSLHLGYLSSVRQFQDFVKRLGEIQKEITRMKQDRDSGAWATAPDRALKEMTLKRYQTQMDIWISHRLVMTTSLLDKVTVDQIMRFYNLVMMWMIRVILVGSGKPVEGIQWAQIARGNYQGVSLIPFPEQVPALFATLPEWIFEDVVEFYLFVCRYKATLLENTLRDELLLFSVAMLQSPAYVKNPHLKSKLVEILFYFTLPLYRNRDGSNAGPRLDVVFSTHEAAKQYLVPGIMRFYVDAEFTGASSAFYDKFSIRYNISQILKAVWEDQNHRLALIRESQKEDFIKFANLLMNDTSYLLDESLGKLSEIHKIQDEMDDATTWNAMPQAAREEREGVLRGLERHAQSYVGLCNETVNMFQYLTSEERVVTPFMAPYIVERLAAMLDYNLTTLVGPKCTDLKVKNPEKYRFNPKSLLTKLVDIFLHLAHRNEFVNAVAKDERSYKKDTFYRACDILGRHGLKDSRDLDSLREFVGKVEEVIRNTMVEDEELGEIPDEYLDPLMATLMEDPVILPTSNITVDRSTIITQLLSNPLDPFNRKPLTIDMVIPNTELKQQIDAWRKQQKSGNATPMQTD